MEKESIKLGIRDMNQDVVHNIELISLLISIILGGAGATLFFVNSLNKINLISITLHELIGTTIFLWAILAFFIYKFILIRSHIIKFLRQKPLWQFIAWFILISIPFSLIEVQHATQDYIGILIFIIISILMWGLLGLIFAIFVNGFIPLHLVIKQIKLIMVISAIIFIVLYMIVLSMVVAENKLNFLDVIFNWTTWVLFFKYLAQVYWFICFLIMLFWSIIYPFKQLFIVLKARCFSVISELKKIEQFLIRTLRIHPLIVRISIVLIIYFVETYFINTLFDSILWEFGTKISFDFSSITARLLLALILLVLVIIPPSCLIVVFAIYLPAPHEQKGFLNKNKGLFILLILLILLWIFLQIIGHKFGIQTPPTSLTIQQYVSFVLLGQGAILLVGLIAFTAIYLTLPHELKRINLHNNIQRMLIILFLLFILWWIFWASLAQNIDLMNQNAFAYVDGRTWKPSILDFLLYTFALMTSASYIELKPLSFGAHILVIAVTSTGLLLLVIFVGAALSDNSTRIRRRRRM